MLKHIQNDLFRNDSKLWPTSVVWQDAPVTEQLQQRLDNIDTTDESLQQRIDRTKSQLSQLQRETDARLFERGLLALQSEVDSIEQSHTEEKGQVKESLADGKLRRQLDAAEKYTNRSYDLLAKVANELNRKIDKQIGDYHENSALYARTGNLFGEQGLLSDRIAMEKKAGTVNEAAMQAISKSAVDLKHQTEQLYFEVFGKAPDATKAIETGEKTSDIALAAEQAKQWAREAQDRADQGALDTQLNQLRQYVFTQSLQFSNDEQAKARIKGLMDCIDDATNKKPLDRKEIQKIHDDVATFAHDKGLSQPVPEFPKAGRLVPTEAAAQSVETTLEKRREQLVEGRRLIYGDEAFIRDTLAKVNAKANDKIATMEGGDGQASDFLMRSQNLSKEASEKFPKWKEVFEKTDPSKSSEFLRAPAALNEVAALKAKVNALYREAFGTDAPQSATAKAEGKKENPSETQKRMRKYLEEARTLAIQKGNEPTFLESGAALRTEIDNLLKKKALDEKEVEGLKAKVDKFALETGVTAPSLTESKKEPASKGLEAIKGRVLYVGTASESLETRNLDGQKSVSTIKLKKGTKVIDQGERETGAPGGGRWAKVSYRNDGGVDVHVWVEEDYLTDKPDGLGKVAGGKGADKKPETEKAKLPDFPKGMYYVTTNSLNGRVNVRDPLNPKEQLTQANRDPLVKQGDRVEVFEANAPQTLSELKDDPKLADELYVKIRHQGTDAWIAARFLSTEAGKYSKGKLSGERKNVLVEKEAADERLRKELIDTIEKKLKDDNELKVTRKGPLELVLRHGKGRTFSLDTGKATDITKIEKGQVRLSYSDPKLIPLWGKENDECVLGPITVESSESLKAYLTKVIPHLDAMTGLMFLQGRLLDKGADKAPWKTEYDPIDDDINALDVGTDGAGEKLKEFESRLKALETKIDAAKKVKKA